MRTFFLRTIGAALLLLSLAPKSMAQIQHDTWTSGAPMPIAVWYAAVGVIDDEIYVVGGITGDWYTSTPIGDTQIYNPTTNSWRKGVPLPVPVLGAAAAVVNNVLYVIGGSTGAGGTTDVEKVWAFNPIFKKWTAKAPIPIHAENARAVVWQNTIYVIGGYTETGGRTATVESYHPTTNTWREEPTLLVGQSDAAVGLFKTTSPNTIITADGFSSAWETGDTESFMVGGVGWKPLTTDPNLRSGTCYGVIGSTLYDTGGIYIFSVLNLTGSFSLFHNTWTALSPMPQGVMAAGSAVYKGRLYCIGGGLGWSGGPVTNVVQIYQP